MGQAVTLQIRNAEERADVEVVSGSRAGAGAGAGAAVLGRLW